MESRSQSGAVSGGAAEPKVSGLPESTRSRECRSGCPCLRAVDGAVGGEGVFKLDGYLTRSLFDLWSNFTFLLADEEFGDEIQQHDSRLQQGVNAQYIRPFIFSGGRALLTVGGNLQAFKTNVGLYPSIGRNPNRAEVSRADP